MSSLAGFGEFLSLSTEILVDTIAIFLAQMKMAGEKVSKFEFLNFVDVKLFNVGICTISFLILNFLASFFVQPAF